MTARLSTGGGALVAGALRSVWLGSARAEQRAVAVAYGPAEGFRGAALDRAVADVRRARRLMPDGAADLARWRLRFTPGSDASDRALLRIARHQPGDVGAWVLLQGTTRDPAVRGRAAAKVRELNPLLADGG